MYALASLDGGQPDYADCAALGLEDRAASQVFVSIPGAVVRAADGEEGGRAVSHAQDGNTVLVFLGHLDDPTALAEAIGCRGETNASIALEAMRKWGADAGASMPGEWSVLRWDASGRELTLGCSRALRDVIYYATYLGNVAVATDMSVLAGLPWVGRDLDPCGFAFSMAQARLRQHRGNTTVLHNVRALEPESFRTFRRTGATRTVHSPLEPLPWHGGFEDAVATVEHDLRAIVRNIMAPHRTIAVFLSGGLDSTLLAWIASQERRADQRVFCLTAVPPPGGAFPDERPFSQAVADQLGLPVEFVWAGARPGVYQPSTQTFASVGSPYVSMRHYLYDALFQSARDDGATAVLDGSGGETSVTRSARFTTPVARVRVTLSRLRSQLRRPDENYPHANYFTRFSDRLLAHLPRNMQEFRSNEERPVLVCSRAPLGLLLGYRQPWGMYTAVPGGGLRRFLPYRHPLLYQRVAGMPAQFLQREGLGRALARTMLKGQVPEFVRLRPRGLPFSADYDSRLCREASSMLQRVAGFRANGIGEWLDLDWLTRMAMNVADGDDMALIHRVKVQLTAAAAEFLLWWKSGGARE